MILNGEKITIKEARKILDKLGHGKMAYHYSIHDVMKNLEKDGNIVTQDSVMFDPSYRS